MSRVFDEGDRMRRWKSRLKDPSEALDAAGLILVAASQRAFKMQRFGRHQWKQRGEINTFGIIADFASGRKSPKKNRFERRPALMDKGYQGGLVSTIKHKVVGKYVEVSANKDYADVHQVGGETESEVITKNLRRLLYMWLKRRGKDYKDNLGWILNEKFIGERIEGEVWARPYIGMTKKAMEDIKSQAGTKLMRAD